LEETNDCHTDRFNHLKEFPCTRGESYGNWNHNRELYLAFQISWTKSTRIFEDEALSLELHSKQRRWLRRCLVLYSAVAESSESFILSNVSWLWTKEEMVKA